MNTRQTGHGQLSEGMEAPGRLCGLAGELGVVFAEDVLEGGW